MESVPAPASNEFKGTVACFCKQNSARGFEVVIVVLYTFDHTYRMFLRRRGKLVEEFLVN